MVQRNRDWLQHSYYAGAFDRYGKSRLKAMRNVARLSMHNLVQPCIINVSDDPAETLQIVGVATIIHDQTIEHPGLGRIVQGTNLDYWLDTEAEAESDAGDLHRNVAEAVREYAGRSVMERAATTVHTSFATIEPGMEHQPVGFAAIMGKRGLPAVLQIPEGGNDPYDVVKGGRTLQLYDWTESLTYLERFA